MNKVVAVSILLAALSAEQASAACVAYYPSIVTVSGKLEKLTFPGRPNFEDVRKGDEPETGFYLSLAEPICTTGEANSGVAYPQSNITSIQLLLNHAGYETFRPWLGKSISISGSLTAAHTGHHHAPLLIDSVSLVGRNVR